VISANIGLASPEYASDYDIVQHKVDSIDSFADVPVKFC